MTTTTATLMTTMTRAIGPVALAAAIATGCGQPQPTTPPEFPPLVEEPGDEQDPPDGTDPVLAPPSGACDHARLAFSDEHGFATWPTDLALDETGSLKPSALGSLSDAERAVLQRAAATDGFPAEVTPFITLPGPAVVNEDEVALVRLDPPARVAVRVEQDGLTVRLVPTEPLWRGRTYAFGLLRGGELDDGCALAPADAVAEAIAHEDGLSPAAAHAQGAIAALVDQDVLQGRILVAATFSVDDGGVIALDATHGDASLPNDLLRYEDGITLPASANVAPAVATVLATRDGFSLSAPVAVRTTSNIDSVGPGAVLLRAADAPSESIDILGQVERERREVEVEHARLSPATTYVTAVTDALTVDGAPARPSLHAAALLVDEPLLAGDGKSQVRFIDSDTLLRLELARQQVAGVRASLADDGTHVQALWPFTTQSVGDDLRSRRQRLYDDSISVVPEGVEETTPTALGMWPILYNVATVTTGTITTLDWLDPLSHADEGAPAPRDIDFIFTWPTTATPGQPVPTVIFGHGLTMSRELVYLQANFLAGEGYAVFAIDLPLHGDRSVCQVDDHCESGATCTDLGTCVFDDGSSARLAAGQSVFLPDGLEMPETTGLGYVDLVNMVATRDHIVQSVVDLSQAVRVVREADWGSVGSGYLPQPDDLTFLGISLGSTLGAAFGAVEEHIDSYALNVGGGDLVDLIMTSERYAEEVDPFLATRGWTRQGDELARYVRDAKWLLDDVEPLNLLGERKPPRMLLQMAIGDTIIPNANTESLGDVTGEHVEGFVPSMDGLMGHGFIVLPFASESVRCRQEILDFFAAR